MIVYDLKCAADHVFEAWFRDSAACDEQIRAGEVACPVCGSADIRKAVMAPNLARGKARGPAVQERSGSAEARKALLELRRQVEANCDYVGERFPEEARRIHYGESEARTIRGAASREEIGELREEGIMLMPVLPPEDELH